MSAQFALRRYHPEDFDAVAALAVHVSSSPETACGQPDVASVDEFRADYGHRPLEREAWVAVTPKEQVIGFAAASLRGTKLIVDGPIVAEGHQHQGVGRHLFEALEIDAAGQGAEVMEAGVRSSNVRGHGFLEAMGYESSREIFVYEAHQPHQNSFVLPEGYTLGELKPRYLLPFLMVMHECFPDYRLPSNPQRLFEPDKMKIFLVTDAEDKPVGAVTAFFYPEDRMAYIYHLGVSQPHRRHGLARALLLAACDWLWTSHEPRFIGLSTSADEPERRQLYEDVGFELQYSLRYLKKAIAKGATA